MIIQVTDHPFILIGHLEATIQVIEKEGLFDKASRNGEFLMRRLRDLYDARGLRRSKRQRTIYCRRARD